MTEFSLDTATQLEKLSDTRLKSSAGEAYWNFTSAFGGWALALGYSAVQQAKPHGLSCRRSRLVRPLPDRAPHRALLEFDRGTGTSRKETLLTIEERRHTYSPEFRALTEDFYLGARSSPAE